MVEINSRFHAAICMAIILMVALLAVSGQSNSRSRIVRDEYDDGDDAGIVENIPSTARPRPRSTTTTTTTAVTTSKPRPRISYCIKHPPNFLDVDLPCGGYDKPSCERVCKQLGRTKAYCTKEVFCLCHNGDLYSC